MIFNGSFAFLQFLVNLPCYSMGITHLFFINFPCYLMGSLHIINFPRYSMGIWGLRSFGGGDGQTYTINGSPLCPTGHWPFGAAAQKGDQPTNRRSNQLTGRPTKWPTNWLTGCRFALHATENWWIKNDKQLPLTYGTNSTNVCLNGVEWALGSWVDEPTDRQSHFEVLGIGARGRTKKCNMI